MDGDLAAESVEGVLLRGTHSYRTQVRNATVHANASTEVGLVLRFLQKGHG